MKFEWYLGDVLLDDRDEEVNFKMIGNVILGEWKPLPVLFWGLRGLEAGEEITRRQQSQLAYRASSSRFLSSRVWHIDEISLGDGIGNFAAKLVSWEFKYVKLWSLIPLILDVAWDSNVLHLHYYLAVSLSAPFPQYLLKSSRSLATDSVADTLLPENRFHLLARSKLL